jgi:predicted nucleic acid-binding protein
MPASVINPEQGAYRVINDKKDTMFLESLSSSNTIEITYDALIETLSRQ